MQVYYVHYVPKYNGYDTITSKIIIGFGEQLLPKNKVCKKYTGGGESDKKNP